MRLTVKLQIHSDNYDHGFNRAIDTDMLPSSSHLCYSGNSEVALGLQAITTHFGGNLITALGVATPSPIRSHTLLCTYMPYNSERGAFAPVDGQGMLG